MKKKIIDFVKEVVNSHHLAGIAVGVVRESQPFIEAGFGVSDQVSRELITPDSLFHLASISKLFVATAVMQLVEQGKVALGDPLAKYLPHVKINNPFGGEINIQHMLSHISGFPDVTDYHWNTPETDDEALERYVHGLDVQLLFAPGTRFSYSNIAYEVLGHLIARVSKISFEEYVKTNILDPLEMSYSTHFRERVPSYLATTPHVSDLVTHASETYPYNRAHSPSSTLHSNVVELNRWAMANLNRGNLANAVILQPSTYKEMWVPRMTVGSPQRPGKHAGLGWFIDNRQNLQMVYHSGQDVGFSTYFLLIPEQSMGVTVLCNTAPAPVEEITFGILDILLGQEPMPIKPPVMTRLGGVYAEKGLAAMKALHAELASKNSQEYDFSAQGFIEVSSALLDCDRNMQAVEILTFALNLFPDNAAEYELLARAYFQSGDMEQAGKYAQRSLEIEPNNLFLRQQIKQLGNAR